MTSLLLLALAAGEDDRALLKAITVHVELKEPLGSPLTAELEKLGVVLVSGAGEVTLFGSATQTDYQLGMIETASGEQLEQITGRLAAPGAAGAEAAALAPRLQKALLKHAQRRLAGTTPVKLVVGGLDGFSDMEAVVAEVRTLPLVKSAAPNGEFTGTEATLDVRVKGGADALLTALTRTRRFTATKVSSSEVSATKTAASKPKK